MITGIRIIDFKTTSKEWKRGVLRGMLKTLNESDIDPNNKRATDYQEQLAELGG